MFLGARDDSRENVNSSLKFILLQKEGRSGDIMISANLG